MFPLYDRNPTYHRPYVTIGLIVVNVAIFLFEANLSGGGQERFTYRYGYLPEELVQGSQRVEGQMREANSLSRPQLQRDPRSGRVFVAPPAELPVEDAVAYPAWFNIFSCMFLHGGWMHLIGNMLYLWIFGNNVEDRLGPVLYLIFYLATGVVGNLAHTLYQQHELVPLVGASGAISGVMGAYMVLLPRSRIVALVPIGWYPATVNLPAWAFLGIYILLQNVYPQYFGGGEKGNVALLAHIGGFLAGMALIFVLPRRSLPPPPPPTQRELDEADFVL